MGVEGRAPDGTMGFAAGVMLDSTHETGRDTGIVGNGTEKVDAPDVPVLPVRDPVDVLRAAFAERARWASFFRDAGLSRQEGDDLLHTMEDARGGQDHVVGRRQRALDQLLGGRGDWFESLLRQPAKLPEPLRVALAEVAAKRQR
jgi:hypothetical protein